MHLVAIAWLYVVVAMAIAEATSPAGTLLGALFTFVLYGALPLAIVLYVLGTPGRRRRAANVEAGAAAASAAKPDGGDHAPGTAVAAEREKA